MIYFEPSFDSYAPIVRLQGATPIAIKLTVPYFAVNWDEVRSAITPHADDHRQYAAQPERTGVFSRRSAPAGSADAPHRHHHFV